MSKISTGQKIKVPAFLCLLGVVGLGAYLRFLALSEPFWLDELHTAWCVSGGWDQVASRAAAGNQSPLFFWLEYLCFSGFGDSALSLRVPSFIASILLMLWTPWLVFRWSGSWLGAVVATGITAVNDQFVFYGVEARSYAMIQVVSLFQVFFFFEMIAEALKGRLLRSRWPKYGLLWCGVTWIFFYLHYTGIILVAAEGLMLLILFIATLHRDQKLPKQIFWLWGCVLVGMLPGLFHLMQLGSGRGAWSSMSNSDAFMLQSVAYGIIYLGPGLCAWSVPRYRQTPMVTEFPKLTWLLFVAVVPILFCYLGTVGHFAPLAHFRFSISSMTLLVVTAGVLVGRLQGRVKVPVAVIIGGLAIATNPLLGWWVDNQAYPDQRQEDWQAVFESVVDDPGTIVFCPNLVEDVLATSQSTADFPDEYYRFALDGLFPVDKFGCSVMPAAIQNASALLSDEQVQQLANENQGFWLLVRAYTGDADSICEDLTGRLAKRGVQVEAKRILPAPLNLFRFTPK